MLDSELLNRAIAYAKLSGIQLNLQTPLGKGQDGSVWESNRKTAVKVFERQSGYEIELNCYQRFKAHNVLRLLQFSVPQLRGFHDELQLIEMSIVTPPYILDFAKAWLDRPADFSAETMADHDEQGRELFGSRWGEVQTLVWSLRQFGIYYYDTRPGNIRFGGDDDL